MTEPKKLTKFLPQSMYAHCPTCNDLKKVKVAWTTDCTVESVDLICGHKVELEPAPPKDDAVVHEAWIMGEVPKL